MHLGGDPQPEAVVHLLFHGAQDTHNPIEKRLLEHQQRKEEGPTSASIKMSCSSLQNDTFKWTFCNNSHVPLFVHSISKRSACKKKR